MNIKRGVWRVWVVLSAAYLVWMAFYLPPKHRGELVHTAFAERIAKEKLVAFYCREARGVLNQDYFLGPSDKAARPDGRCWYPVVKARALFEAPADLTDEQLINVRLNQMGPYKSYERDVVNFITIFHVLAGPIAMLLIGLILSWMLAGFARRPEA